MLDTSGEPLKLALAAAPYMAKPNISEAEAWVGSPIRSAQQAAEAVDNFLKTGITLVALSLGVDGLMLASTEVRVWARPPGVAVRNPVGAGDALVAGLIWALAEDLPLTEAARWGVAAGTAAAIREGVEVGTREEVEAVDARVTLQPWPVRE